MSPPGGGDGSPKFDALTLALFGVAIACLVAAIAAGPVSALGIDIPAPTSVPARIAFGGVAVLAAMIALRLHGGSPFDAPFVRRLAIVGGAVAVVAVGLPVIRPAGPGADGTVRFTVFSPIRGALRDSLVARARTDLDVELEWGSPARGSEEVAQAIRAWSAEHDRENALVLGGSFPMHDELARNGFLWRLPRGFRDEQRAHVGDLMDDYWIGWYRGILSIACRPDRVDLPPQGVCGWTDLVDAVTAPGPDGPGIVLTDPRASMGGRYLGYALFKSFDDTTATRMLRELYARCACSSGDAREDIDRLVEGTAVASVNWDHDLRRALHADSIHVDDIRIVIPRGTPWEVGAVSVLATTEDHDNGLRILTWLLGDEVGRLQHDLGGRYPVSPTPHAGMDSDAIQDLLLPEQDFASDRPHMQERFDRVEALWPPGIPACSENP